MKPGLHKGVIHALALPFGINGRHHAHTWKCKILLPKFNTCWQALLERKKDFEVPLCSIVGRFSAKNFCRFSEIALPLHCNGDAISLKRQRDYTVTAMRLHCNGDAKSAYRQRLETVKYATS